MKEINLTSYDEIINKLVSTIEKQAAKQDVVMLTKFIKLYYANISVGDLRARSVVDLSGAVLSHWSLLKKRQLGESHIRAFNPHFEQHGWQSTHTIVEVLTDDMPFLVDSIQMEINRLGLSTHLSVHLGGLNVVRNAQGELTDLLDFEQRTKKSIAEAPIYLEVDRQTDPHALEDIRANLLRVLHDVRATVEDWQGMCHKVESAIDQIHQCKAPLSKGDVDESIAFLKWLVNDRFTFLGYRDYKLIKHKGEKSLQIVPGSGLGVLRDDSKSKSSRYFSDLPKEAQQLALSKQILIISKTNTKSTVHRPAYTDLIIVKWFDDECNITGMSWFVGLYTSEAYNASCDSIPFLRHKVETVLHRSKLSRRGHAAKTLLNILETFPRDDLFQASIDELYDLIMGIFQLQNRRQTRLFVRKDAYGRFISCLVYMPRDNFHTDILYRVQVVLESAFSGFETTYSTYFPESLLARVHYVIRIDPQKQIRYNIAAIERQIADITRSWKDDLRDCLLEYFGEEQGNELINKYLRAFPAGYREAFTSRSAIYDIEHIEMLSPQQPLGMSFYRPLGAEESTIRFKLFHRKVTVPLSDALPMLENMGLRVIGEQPYCITFQDNMVVWINDFSMLYAEGAIFNVEDIKEAFQQTFYNVWSGAAENDGFNRLVLAAQVTWREISVLRALAKYFRQTGFTFSQDYIEETLVSSSRIAKLIVSFFHARFDPALAHKSKKLAAEVEEQIYSALDEVINLDEDRIFRRYVATVKAVQRTNYFQTDNDGKAKSYISFKFDPDKIPDLPRPLPQFEIFVYSPRFEGVHLRAAKVARGGIRWSDRREDFRTEVLGLVKAQKVKNAVIVASGAKGGFVPKQLPTTGNRDDIYQEGEACYKDFIRGLLDLTDNIVNGKIVSPANTVCYDDADPYLVVAADKGTATFSDIANEISKEYNFWLGDAFASGGKTGYDHKKMGITARGAWVAVERYFREMNLNPQVDDFTVVGIGDMSGDVFGNGMLLSKHIKLVAAFNHMHVFIDPNPDPEKSYAERKRLFNLPRSTWGDYNPKLISKGGGVYRRTAKAIKLPNEVRKMLHIKPGSLVPNELISALLKAPVDLIWNGGIGTYVKASFEDNVSICDRANDNVRINANQLRCKAIVEGGNLGVSQLGRIEFGLNGGKVNTDFIDNSAGVDCSDHEVNIKILLSEIVSRGDITEKQRNSLLAKMTDEVAELVLQDNYRQTRAISLAVDQAQTYSNIYIRYVNALEENGKLDRELEFLPDEKTLLERRAAGKYLTRPEIAVLLAYSKIIIKDEILASSLPEDSFLSSYIESAFPEPLRKRANSNVKNHYLYREIIATQLTNRIIADMGISFVYQMHDEMGASTPEIVRAYAVASHLFNMPDMWADIDRLDYVTDVDTQNQMILDVMRLVRRATRWFLRNRKAQYDITATVGNFSKHVACLYKLLPKLLPTARKERMDAHITSLVNSKVPSEIAKKIASLPAMYSALNIIETTATANFKDINEVAVAYFHLMDKLDLVWFREQINAYRVDSHWAVLARAAFKGDLDWLQRKITIGVLKLKSSTKTALTRVDQWLQQYSDLVGHWQGTLLEIRSSTEDELAMITVAMRELSDLAKFEDAEDVTE